MDELEFRKRIYANPRELDQEVIDAAGADPVLQKILDESLRFEDSLGDLLASPEIPEGLVGRLQAIPEAETASGDEAVTAGPSNVSPLRASKPSFFQYYAIAASLILAVGIVFSLMSNSGPSPADAAFGDELLAHLYHDNLEIDDITGGAAYALLELDEVNINLANTGTRMVSLDSTEEFGVRSAKPCEILPAYESAHLVLQGSRGAISVIVINNSPVDVEFSIRDDRFEGIVLPMEGGNMVLVGEKDEDLSHYASLFAENVEWVI